MSGVRGRGLAGRLFAQLDDCLFLVHDELRAGSMREAIAAASGVSRGRLAYVGTMQDTFARDLNKNRSLVAKYGSEDLKAMLARVDKWHAAVLARTQMVCARGAMQAKDGEGSKDEAGSDVGASESAPVPAGALGVMGQGASLEAESAGVLDDMLCILLHCKGWERLGAKERKHAAEATVEEEDSQARGGHQRGDRAGSWGAAADCSVAAHGAKRKGPEAGGGRAVLRKRTTEDGAWEPRGSTGTMGRGCDHGREVKSPLEPRRRWGAYAEPGGAAAPGGAGCAAFMLEAVYPPVSHRILNALRGAMLRIYAPTSVLQACHRQQKIDLGGDRVRNWAARIGIPDEETGAAPPAAGDGARRRRAGGRTEGFRQDVGGVVREGGA